MNTIAKINQLEKQLKTLVAQSNKSAEEIQRLNEQVNDLTSKLIMLDCDRIIAMLDKPKRKKSKTDDSVTNL